MEPGEITAALDRHPDVLESLVLAQEDPPADKRLVAYVVLGGAAGVSPAVLRAFLRSSLPDYMVPSTFVEVDDFDEALRNSEDFKAHSIHCFNEYVLRFQLTEFFSALLSEERKENFLIDEVPVLADCPARKL